MKRKLINTVYYDSLYYACEFPYEEYKEMCEDCGWTCHKEDSPGYWEDMAELAENEWGDFEANMEYSKFKGQPCMITGTLGLWHGTPTIIPVLCDDIMAAIKRCLDCNYQIEYTIELKDGHINVNVSHHDGTNCFEIWLLSEKGKREVQRPMYQWQKDYEPKRWWFKNIYGYLF